MAAFICIGVPYWLGEPLPAGNEVTAVASSGLAEAIGAEWVTIEPDLAAAPDPVTAVNRALARTIRAHPGKIPLMFVGDCTACIGAVKGLEAVQPAVLWYDAHGDFNTTATTPSGFLGGMPLAALVGRDNQHLMQGVDLAPLAETDVIITDARDLDPQEGVNLRASQITLLPDVNDLLNAPLPDKPIYIHFDADVLHLDDNPAVNYPAQGGTRLPEMIATLHRVIRDGEVVGILFTLWDAELDGAATSQSSILQIAQAIAEELQA